MKKIVTLLISLILCLSLFSPNITNASTIKLNKSKLTLNEGKTYSLKLTGTSKSVKWSTSKKSVATVSKNGLVKAVTVGTADITATVSSKKYVCKVTVKEVFDKKKALDNISEDISDLGNGLVDILENDYSFSLTLVATAIFYDSEGNMLGKSTDSNLYLEKGKKCALYFIGPYDENYNDVPYNSYKIVYELQAVPSFCKSNLADIVVSSNFGAGNIMVEVVNQGKITSSFTKVCVIFYKDGNIVGYDCHYANVDEPGSTDYIEFPFPYDTDFSNLQIDDYDIIVNYSV